MFLHPEKIKSKAKALVHSVMSSYRLSRDLFKGRFIGGGSGLCFGNTVVMRLLYMHVRSSYVTSRNSTANKLTPRRTANNSVCNVI
jgi:hypothetical protein